MDRRTKILAGIFGAFIAYAVLGNVVYPRWIEPILVIDERIAERRAYLTELQRKEDEVWDAKREYKNYLDRVGSLDKSKVENTLRERINALVENCKLEDVGTTWGSVRARTDKKTGITSMTIVVSAAGTLQGAVRSLKELAELPNLAQLGSVKITPDRGGRGSQSTDRVDIRIPLEVWVLSVPRIMEKRFEDEDLNQPESYVRHDGR
ncbi:MAG: hypothetical protein KJ749_04815, partial [Planctomycetes bacterium]|nr:hypothetical protein [Planctomycetota bacterium]